MMNTHPAFVRLGIGKVKMLGRGELDSHTCDCGNPKCFGDSVELFPACGHGRITAIYLKGEGVIILCCPVDGCRNGTGFRLAADA